MKRNRLYFTLLEVLIALGLTLLILSSLMAAYLNIEKSAAWWQKEENALFAERFFSHRLLEVFSHLEEIDQNKTFFFTTQAGNGLQLPETMSLVFSYDNEASLDTSLSGSVLGRLFVDNEGNLTLLTWPERESWKDLALPPFHREVLMKKVKGLQFSFFILSNEQEANPINAAWTKGGFSKDQKELPGAIKLIITSDEGIEKAYYFPVPQTLSVITEKA